MTPALLALLTFAPRKGPYMKKIISILLLSASGIIDCIAVHD